MKTLSLEADYKIELPSEWVVELDWNRVLCLKGPTTAS